MLSNGYAGNTRYITCYHYFSDNTGKLKFAKKQVNDNCIIENLPNKTRIEFRRNLEHRQIINKDNNNQLSLQEIIDVLEKIEENEPQTTLYKNGSKPNGNRQKNMYNKPGHSHEWKYCPDNPYKENWKKKSPDKEHNVLEAEST